MIINPAQQIHGQEEIDAAVRVVKAGFWAEGGNAMKFKRDLCKLIGTRYAVLTNSGSSANLAAIMALTTHWIPEDRRLKQGDEIITSALCFPTTVSPIKYAGCIPVFVDVEPGTWNINPDQVEEMITPKTKAIIVAHNLGNPFNLTRIKEICDKYNLWLIQDCCDALCSKWNGENVGMQGDIATSSFYPAHHVSTGEGGAVYVNNPLLFRSVSSMVNWGRDCWCDPGEDDVCHKRYGWQLGNLPMGYDHKNSYAELGFNLKMTDIQAAIGVEQLKRLDGFIKARTYNHAFLRDLFSKYEQWFELPQKYEEADPNWFGYVIKLKKNAPFTRDEMVVYLEKAGIRSRAFFCGNITKQPCFHNRDDNKFKSHSDLSVSDDIMSNAFWIGVHPGIGETERLFMNETILGFLNKYQ